MPKASAQKQTRHKVTIYTLIFALLGLSLIAATGDMGTLESKVFDWIYTMPDSLRWFALLTTQLGNFWFAIGIVGLLFVIRWNPALSLVVLKNTLVAYVVVQAVKLLVGRPRPMILLSEVTAREMAVFGNGFPSGHTALATVVSLTLLPYLPKYLRWLPVVWIGLVAWSRIYLGVHAPLDVVGGIIIGLLVAKLVDLVPWPNRLKT